MRSLLSKIVFLGTLTFTGVHTFGQQIDSMKLMTWSPDYSDSLKFIVCKELVRVFRVNSPDTALVYARKAYDLANALRSTDSIVESLNLIGTCYYYQGQPDADLAFQESAIELAAQNDLPEPLAIARNSAGIALLALGNYAGAAEQFLHVLTHSRATGDTLGEVRSIINLLETT